MALTTATSSFRAQCTDAETRYFERVGTAQIAQCILGGVGVALQVLVLSTIFAYNKDRRSLRARIIAGLFVANLVFSFSFMLPTWALDGCTIDSETQLAVGVPVYTSYGTQTAGRAYRAAGIYGGKFYMACYEIFIIALSTNVLLTGRDRIPLRYEMAAHGTCLVVAAIIFVLVGARGTEIFKRIYPATDSLANDELESDYTDLWLVTFSIVILLWIQQKLYLRRLMREWNQGLSEAVQDWNRDLWNTGDQAVRDARDRKRLLLDKQKEAYLEVVQPLAPYVYVFMVFCVPAVIIATRPCNQAQEDINRAPCMSICFTLLSARPVATAGVYFSDKQCRSELLDFCTLRRKLWLRLSNSALSCVGQSELRASDRVRFVLEPSVREYDRDGRIGGGSNDIDGAEEGMPYELMQDEDTAQTL